MHQAVQVDDVVLPDRSLAAASSAWYGLDDPGFAWIATREVSQDAAIGSRASSRGSKKLRVSATARRMRRDESAEEASARIGKMQWGSGPSSPRRDRSPPGRPQGPLPALPPGRCGERQQVVGNVEKIGSRRILGE